MNKSTTQIQTPRGSDNSSTTLTRLSSFIEEWKTTTLGEVADIRNGATPNTQIADYWNGSIPWCTPTDITSTQGKYILTTKRSITMKGLTSSAVNLLPVGALLLCSRATIGEIKISAFPVCTNQGFKSLVCKDDIFNEYLYYLLIILKPQIIERAIGSTFLEISKHGVASIEIKLPPYNEQLTIAKALSDMDGLLGALEALIAKKQAIKQTTMQQLLTGKIRLPGFSGKWESLTLDKLEKRGDIKLFRGKVISQKDINRLPGDHPIYSSSVNSNGLFGSYGEYMFDEDLITWSIDGGGDFFYRSKHRFSVTNVCGYLRIIISKIDYQYLAYHLCHLHSRKFFDYTLKAHPSVIRNSYIIALPQLKEQIAIATILSDIDTEITTLEQRREKTHTIKQGMMQQLLTGRIRLVRNSENK